MLDLGLPTDLKGILALLAGLDIKIVLALATAIVSVWLFLGRYREEAKKTRITRLETRSLDQLFRFREQLISCVDGFEDLPDVTDDNTAHMFCTTLRSIRHNLRRSIDEYALFGTADEYQQQFRAFSEADEPYRVFSQGLADRRIDYKLANRFKRPLYQLLQDIDIRIVEIQEIDGRSREREKDLVRSKYQNSIAEIDELLNQPSQWTPVQSPRSASSSGATAAS